MEGGLISPNADRPLEAAAETSGVRGRVPRTSQVRHRTPRLSLLPDAVKRRYAPNWRRTLLVTGLVAATILAVGYGAVLVVAQQSTRMRAAILRSEIAGYAAKASQARYLEREVLTREAGQASARGRTSADGSAFLALLALAPPGVAVQTWQQAGHVVHLSFASADLAGGLRYASALAHSRLIGAFAILATTGTGPVTFQVAFQLGAQP